MRLLFTITLTCTLVGCGSKSSTPETASTESTSTQIGQSPGAAAASVTGGDSQATADVSGDVETLVQKAKAAVAARQGRIAVEALSQAIGFDAGSSELFHMRADVYNLMGEYANARADFSLAVRLDPKNPNLYNARGYFLMTRGVTVEAFADFKKAVELNPTFPVAWNNRGLIRLAEKNYEAAIADFGKAVELDDKYVDALNNRGFAFMKHGKLDKALVDLKKAVKLKPDYTTAWNNCGLAFMQQENYEAAASAFSEAVKLAPLDVRWRNHRRAAWLKLEKFEEATADAQEIRWIDGLTQLTQQVSQKANDPRVWLARAEHLENGEQFAAAAGDYSNVLALQPGSKRALLGRAGALLKVGEQEKAIADCDAVIGDAETGDPSPMAFSIRGDAWLALGDLDKGIADLERAQRMDDALVSAYQQRAAKRDSAGENSEAKQDLAKANQLQQALAGKLPQRTSQKQIPFPTN